MGLHFLAKTANVGLVGPNGVGKSMIARHIAHQARLAGHTVLFTSASPSIPSRACWSLTRSAIGPTPTVMPTYSLRSSPDAMRLSPPSSPLIARNA